MKLSPSTRARLVRLAHDSHGCPVTFTCFEGRTFPAADAISIALNENSLHPDLVPMIAQLTDADGNPLSPQACAQGRTTRRNGTGGYRMKKSKKDPALRRMQTADEGDLRMLIAAALNFLANAVDKENFLKDDALNSVTDKPLPPILRSLMSVPLSLIGPCVSDALTAVEELHIRGWVPSESDKEYFHRAAEFSLTDEEWSAVMDFRDSKRALSLMTDSRNYTGPAYTAASPGLDQVLFAAIADPPFTSETPTI